MSLFDGLKSLVGDVMGQDGAHPALGGIVEYLNNQPGGIAGLVQRFRENGMGSVVESWLSNGSNQPISAEQVSQVLGDHVDTLAQKTGLDSSQISGLLAKFLPSVVDKASPGGQLPSA